MAITIVAENISDAANKLGLSGRSAAIKIDWRRGEHYDYQSKPEYGCIVDATSVPGEETKRAFAKSSDALRYIAAMFKKRDDFVRDDAKKRAHAERLNKALAAKKKRCES